MTETLRITSKNLVAFLIGGFLALLMAPVVVEASKWLLDWYDDARPPSSAKLVKVERAGDGLRLQFEITRHRDCDFINLVGFTGSGPTDMQIATILRREDGSAPQSYPAGVTAISRVWWLWPTYGPRLVVYGYYDCAGRAVRTKMIDQLAWR